jgi:integrase
MPGLQQGIAELFTASFVCDVSGRTPRVHDLRHSFAVMALTRWYRRGADVQTLLPRLAMYMGHVSLESTAYYLRLTQELAALASARFEQRFADMIDGGQA